MQYVPPSFPFLHNANARVCNSYQDWLSCAVHFSILDSYQLVRSPTQLDSQQHAACLVETVHEEVHCTHLPGIPDSESVGDAEGNAGCSMLRAMSTGYFFHKHT